MIRRYANLGPALSVALLFAVAFWLFLGRAGADLSILAVWTESSAVVAGLVSETRLMNDGVRKIGMIGVDSGTMRSPSVSTGNLPTGQSFRNGSRLSALCSSTSCGVNGVPFSYSAISALWQ